MITAVVVHAALFNCPDCQTPNLARLHNPTPCPGCGRYHVFQAEVHRRLSPGDLSNIEVRPVEDPSFRSYSPTAINDPFVIGKRAAS